MTSALREQIHALDSALQQSEAGVAAVLEQVTAAAARWSNADRVSLIQFDQDAKQVKHFVRGGTGWSEVMATIGYDELQAGLSGWALRTGQVALSPSNVPDSRESADVQKRRRETHCGAILVAPLGSGGQWLGTMTLINRTDQLDFTESDAADLELFARYVTWVMRWALEQERSAGALFQAESALRSKTQFLSNLSHELRTPLNGVIGFSQLLGSSISDPNQRVMVDTILGSGQRLLATVDNLLELALLETGEFHLENAPFSPRAVLESVAARHHQAAVSKRLGWQMSTSPDLPDLLDGDPVRLGQAWDYILSNAVKFTERGSISLHLESRQTTRGRTELTLNVTDTGVGLATAPGRWIMPFHQEDGSLTRKFGGTGLGLTLADRIVGLMNGGISLRGEPGVGTQVRLWVELGKDARPTHLRVLLQDSDPVASLVLVRLLEHTGHRVDYVTDPSQLWERAATQAYELVIAEAPANAPERLAALRAAPHEGEFALIGLYTADTPPNKDEPWTTTLMKPVTRTTLLAALRRSRSWEER